MQITCCIIDSYLFNHVGWCGLMNCDETWIRVCPSATFATCTYLLFLSQTSMMYMFSRLLDIYVYFGGLRRFPSPYAVWIDTHHIWVSSRNISQSWFIFGTINLNPNFYINMAEIDAHFRGFWIVSSIWFSTISAFSVALLTELAVFVHTAGRRWWWHTVQM